MHGENFDPRFDSIDEAMQAVEGSAVPMNVCQWPDGRYSLVPQFFTGFVPVKGA